MRVLFLGGTRFVGLHMAAAAIERGHEVTLFHRGESDPGPRLARAERVRGDRDGGLHALGDRRWDAVIDTCGYVPRLVRQSAEYLADRTDLYVFISTISVYGDLSRPFNEETPLASMDDPTTEDVNGKTYGPLKVLCERAAEEAMPGRVLQIRPGVVVGPDDYTDRFTYWVRRAAEGGEMLTPGPQERPMQFIDVRDLGAWTVVMTERGGAGVYQATGPAQPCTMAALVEAARLVATELGREAARPVWVDEPWLLEHGARPGDDLPLWIPECDPGRPALMQGDSARARRAGLEPRPALATVRDTLAWDLARGLPPLAAGMSRERERDLLGQWWGVDMGPH